MKYEEPTIEIIGLDLKQIYTLAVQTIRMVIKVGSCQHKA